ncbi:4,5-DOPA dioxygenase extradiol [Tenacibaculum sp. TC6]|uniref:4,5-DOPA-extradiol-dioxygenase n=1 Tax=Tenacibaculum sp. TC6 TaxID=3423223 RepID=UPI003D362998
MKRTTFLQLLGLSSLAMTAKPLSELEKLTDLFSKSPKMPVLFLGHGDPMNAIRENKYTQGFKEIAKTIPVKPNAIICISAHWLTKGTQITAMENPRTIHDFGGFPQELYEVQYPAKGSEQLAEETSKLFYPTPVTLDYDWGLDHGAWSVIKHLYPNADIPVLQLSIDYYKPATYHYELAKKLSQLRHKGILIIGSGNIVHNLRKLSYQDDFGHDWAIEARHIMNQHLLNNNHKALINYDKLGSEVQLSIPTPDHYYPLIYTLGLQEKNETVTLFNDTLTNGAISMTSLKIS